MLQFANADVYDSHWPFIYQSSHQAKYKEHSSHFELVYLHFA